ncbi:MAG: hypothetical protein ABS76_07635 [Pelagibacterium sp. SCN 64-44]|nr:MAG: hypothetical protein ABS76_07635 [Pelagibacterium sp. SCN 64-44]
MSGGRLTALCDRIVATTSADLDETVLHHARRLVLDGLSVGVAGARVETAPKIMAAHLAAMGSSPISTALGAGLKLAPPQAALLNAVAMHALDFEPMWSPATHALSPALAAALAIGEAKRAGGLEILVAMVKGIEMQGRILVACGPYESLDLRLHPPGLVGPMGAAVAGAHILGLDADQLGHALGIAASRCGGLVSNTGTMTKATHPGYAAALGLEAAMLAARGYTGNGDLDAETGYAEALLPAGFDSARLLEFGVPFRVRDPGYAIKIFPSKITTHYAITAALQARVRVPDAGAVRAIRVVAPLVPAANRPAPASGHEGKFSIQFTLAAALLDGEVTIQTFTDARLHAADMQALLPKIDVEMRADITTQYSGGRFLQMEVELADGTIFTERCDSPRGTWGTEPISDDELAAKARGCLTTAFDPDHASELVSRLWRFDAMDADEISALLAQLGQGDDTPVAEAAHG